MDAQTPLLLLGGLLFLVVGADLLVRGASRLAVAAGISPLVVGLTVVALGTSAPELAVTVESSLSGETALALGNVVGSNISNVLLVLGIGALVVPLAVAQKVVRLELPLMILVSAGVWALAHDGSIGRIEGLLLVLVSVGYTAFLIRQSRTESRAIQAEYAQEWGPESPEQTAPARGTLLRNTGLMIGGLVLLVLGAQGVVHGALDLGRWLGISELVSGLTIVALGTSAPEVATVVVASLKGERDIAVGNVVGSNLYNLMVVLGLGAAASETGLEVPAGALHFDLPVMLAVAVVCLPIFLSGFEIARWEGGLLIAYYLAYVGYMVMDSQGHDLLPQFSSAMVVFVIPLTILTLGLTVLHSLRRRGGPPPEPGA